MGNYYEGDLRFVLKKDTPEDILKDLIKISFLNDRNKLSMMNISKKFLETDWLKHERCDYPNYTFNICVKENDDYSLKEVEKEVLSFLPNISEYFERLKEKNDDIYECKKRNKKEIVSYVFDISFCMKGYQYLGEYIFDYLFPYIDNSMYDMSYGGCVGHIKDEDGTYDKFFFIDVNLYKKEIESRQYLCKDCKLGFPNELCKYWERCYRAYEIGKKKGDS